MLSRDFPRIRLDGNGVCQHCAACAPSGEREVEKERLEGMFRDLIAGPRADGPYDTIMAYSGGKDSTFVLKILKRDFSLRVLAVTFDNHFLPAATWENIARVTQKLGVDRLVMSPDRGALFDAFRKSVASDIHPQKALQRASAICSTCMLLAKSFVLKCAVEMGIPLMAYGWSPGQAPIRSSILKMTPALIRQRQGILDSTLRPVMGDALDPFLLRGRHLRMLDGAVREDGRAVYSVHPLAFLGYDEDDIVARIADLGWVRPGGTDANSTNCLLNAYAIRVHRDRWGFHPYAFEIAGLVREGYMTREAGLEKLSAPPDEKVVAAVERELGMRGKAARSEAAQNPARG